MRELHVRRYRHTDHRTGQWISQRVRDDDRYREITAPTIELRRCGQAELHGSARDARIDRNAGLSTKCSRTRGDDVITRHGRRDIEEQIEQARFAGRNLKWNRAGDDIRRERAVPGIRQRVMTVIRICWNRE